MQEGKGIFVNNNIKKTNKNYPVGEKQIGWAGQDRTGQDTRHTQHTITNQHGSANTRRF